MQEMQTMAVNEVNAALADKLKAVEAEARAYASEVLSALAGAGVPTPEAGYERDGGAAQAGSDIRRALRLTLNAYQHEARRTAAALDASPLNLAIMALGVAGEAGEVADYVKKVVGHGHALDRDKLAKELGDVLWYVAVLAGLLELELADVAQRNVDKLRARYPEGFSTERSVNRHE